MALVAAVYVVGRSFTRKRGEILLVAVAVVDAGVFVEWPRWTIDKAIGGSSVSTKQDVDSYFDSDSR